MAARGLRPKKHLGQHFLMDGGAAARIARLCAPESDARVVEIGPGTGALTRALIERDARVTAIEIDADLVALLRERDDLASAEIVHADALAFDYDGTARGAPWCAAGNLPYNVGTPLVLRWLDLQHPPERVVVMVQRDVAERFGARPATPAYGSLSIVVQLAMSVRRAFLLDPQAFYPRPKVESAVVVMERHGEPPVALDDRAFFLQVVRGAFAYRRKTLANSLSLALGIDRSRTTRSLARLDLDPEIRGEQLDLVAFAALANDLGS